MSECEKSFKVLQQARKDFYLQIQNQERYQLIQLKRQELLGAHAPEQMLAIDIVMNKMGLNENEIQIEHPSSEGKEIKSLKKKQNRKQSTNKQSQYERKRRFQQLHYYRHLFQHFDYLISIPSDFNRSNYLICHRPVGTRSIVVAQNMRTIAVGKNGQILDQFSSYLPGGFKRTLSTQEYHKFNYCIFTNNPKQDKTCILDCVYDKAVRTYYVLDVLMWKDQDFTSCDTECRCFWLKQNVFCNPQELSHANDINERPFVLVNKFDLEAASLQSLYNAHSSKDHSLLFYYKKGWYKQGGASPFVHIWREFEQQQKQSMIQLNANLHLDIRRNKLLTLDGFTIKDTENQQSIIDDKRIYDENELQIAKLNNKQTVNVTYSSILGIIGMEMEGEESDDIEEELRFETENPSIVIETGTDKDQTFQIKQQNIGTIGKYIHVAGLQLANTTAYKDSRKSSYYKLPDLASKLIFQWQQCSKPLTIQIIHSNIQK